MTAREGFRIGRKSVGGSAPIFIIGELSANHLHRLDVALDVVRAAADAGADALKIQTLTPDTMTIDCEKDWFLIKGDTPWSGRKLYDLYSETPLPYEWHEPIVRECERLGLECFSTPYDHTAVDFLDQFDPPAYKIASFEITDIPLIRYVARKGKPVILSTGVANLVDIHEAVQACFAEGNTQVALLKCTSSYPAPFEEINLKTLPNMVDAFGVVGGVSDHTLGHEIAVASVCLGGSIIEKHLTVDRSMGGPDAGFSMEPAEFKALVSAVRNTEAALGRVTYELSGRVQASRRMFARSLFFVADVAEGELISSEHVRSIRPGNGLSPKHLEAVIGRRARKNISRGTPVEWESLA